MFKSLRIRLIAIYSLIIALTIVAVDILILDNYLKSLIEEKRITYFTYGNMVSNAVAGNISDTLYVSNVLEQYGHSTDARFLLIDPDSRVISDSMHRYTGQTITNQQIRSGLQGQESWALYSDGDNIMQMAVPVISGPKDNTTLHGVILISADIDDLYNSYRALRLKVIAISAAAGIVSTIISMITGYRLSSPLKKLIRFSRRLSRGHLGETIDINRKDEIGLLADTINSLSAELYRIEKNRRSFIGNVSHELKTPLASIKALVESMLLTKALPEQHREFLEDVIGEVDRLSSLITSLLTFTRLGQCHYNRAYHKGFFHRTTIHARTGEVHIGNIVGHLYAD
jgi:two-component system OmpR family sensor kinase